MTAVEETPIVPAQAPVREGDYGQKVVAVEPGGSGWIPLHERHGRPRQLFLTWTSPNFEFATVFVGVIAVLYFGLSFWQALLGIALGTALGSLTHGILSARGPRYGAPQMVLSRLGFGYWGNVLPAGINAVVAGIGWFAVNSVSGAFALAALTHLPTLGCLLIIVAVQLVIAFLGHNLIQVFERYVFPVLAVAFLLACGVLFAKFHPGTWSTHSTGGIGGYLLTIGAAFGYAAGWNPYAADYTRYLPATASRRATGWWAGLGIFVSCVLLELAGAAAATLSGGNWATNPTGAFTGHLPVGIAKYTLLAIALGAVSANALNIYSGALSFTALGIRLPFKARRAIVAAVFGVAGFFVAWSGLHDAASKYNNFLLVIAYWIAPWLGVYFTDQILRRREKVEGLLYDARHRNWPGPVAMAVGMGLSIWLFSKQTEYVGWVPSHHPAVGDLTFEVGFVVSAVLYAVLFRLVRRRRTIALP